jgi:hypothetical protein
MDKYYLPSDVNKLVEKRFEDRKKIISINMSKNLNGRSVNFLSVGCGLSHRQISDIIKRNANPSLKTLCFLEVYFKENII